MNAAITTRAPCPQCDRGPRDTALAVTIDERGRVEFCHRCGYTATEHRETRSHAPVRTTSSAGPLDWSTRAESIWRKSQPLAGSLGQVYLHHRGCVLPPRDSHLRYLAGNDRYPPSLCAAITDVITAQPISLHFTRLAADGKGKAGTDRDKLLLAGHRKRGGCIRLWPDECVTHGLGIAEGIETALAAAHAYTPVWSTIDCSNLAAFPTLNGIESLLIFADNDDAGRHAADECGQRWADAGREVRIAIPEETGADINDLVSA
jgi:putative DNA primase/helicase